MKEQTTIETGKKTVGEILADRLISSLNNPDGSYNMPPWRTAPSKPYNPTTGIAYSGINRFLLAPLVTSHDGELRFLTAKQITALGGKIKRGATSGIVYYMTSGKTPAKEQTALIEMCATCKYATGSTYECTYNLANQNVMKTAEAKGKKVKCSSWRQKAQYKSVKEYCDHCKYCQRDKCTYNPLYQTKLYDDEAKGIQNICMHFLEKGKISTVPRYYKVYNFKDTEGIDESKFKVSNDPVGELNTNMINGILNGLVEYTNLTIMQGRAYSYDISTDTIHLLGLADCNNNKSLYYAGILKMLAFSTGYEDRLNLPYMFTDKSKAGMDDELSYGSVVAEMAMNLLAGTLNHSYKFEYDDLYIIQLITKMNEDKNFIVMAASSANRIYNYLMDIGRKYLAEHPAA